LGWVVPWKVFMIVIIYSQGRDMVYQEYIG